jgi:CubicO group peptidase (beta-lactamase class C family)
MMHEISRRTLLGNLIGGAAAGIVARRFDRLSAVRAEELEHNGSRAAMFRIARSFMEQYEVPGLSASITRHGKFVYEHQFGMADKQGAQQLLPNSLFRIASVTKPIT